MGNTIGQANAVSDKVLDLRRCNFSGKNLSGKTLAGALLSETDMTNSNLQEAVLTKARQHHVTAYQPATALPCGSRALLLPHHSSLP